MSGEDDMLDGVNSQGHGVSKASWSDRWGWWAWTPDGLITGDADSKDDAERAGATAMAVIDAPIRGQG